MWDDHDIFDGYGSVPITRNNYEIILMRAIARLSVSVCRLTGPVFFQYSPPFQQCSMIRALFRSARRAFEAFQLATPPDATLSASEGAAALAAIDSAR